MPAARVHPAPDVAFARDFLAHFSPGQHSVFAVVKAPVAELRLGLDPAHAALAGRRKQVARAPFTLDPGRSMRPAMIDFASSQRAQSSPVRDGPRTVRGRPSTRACRYPPALRCARSPPTPAPFRLEHDDRIPRSTRCRAAEIPVNPAPTTQTSALSRPASAGRGSRVGTVAAYQEPDCSRPGNAVAIARLTPRTSHSDARKRPAARTNQAPLCAPGPDSREAPARGNASHRPLRGGQADGSWHRRQARIRMRMKLGLGARASRPPSADRDRDRDTAPARELATHFRSRSG